MSVIEKSREFNLETHLIFIDYEKAFYRVNREILWGIMHKRGIPLHLIQACQSLYQDTNILTDGEEVQTKQGVRQGCGLSPTLLNIYIDDVIRAWRSSVAPGIPLNMNISVNNFAFCR